MSDPRERAERWLRQTYGARAELSGAEPVAETPGAWLFGCVSTADAGPGKKVMLNASVAVPKNGAVPFHPATDDPLGDLAAFGEDPRPRSPADQARRTNARGAVLAAHAALDGASATPLPWKPEDETPGWWDRLVGQCGPGAESFSCESWEDVTAALEASGPDARGIVWIRRETGGAEFSGHLLCAHNNDGRVALLDPQRGGLGRAETDNVRKLTLALAPGSRPDPAAAFARPAWRAPADGFDAAVAKAGAWLAEAYGGEGEVVLVDPSPADEGPRGWLFACNTARFAETGNWENGMLDAALVVPKDASRPFALPNSSPWEWLREWQEGATPSQAPPEPGPASWLRPVMRRLGGVISSSTHSDWRQLTAVMAGFPEGSRAVVWLRRNDARGRESVGLLLNGACTADGIVLIDSVTREPARLETEGVRALHLIRYR